MLNPGFDSFQVDGVGVYCFLSFYNKNNLLLLFIIIIVLLFIYYYYHYYHYLLFFLNYSKTLSVGPARAGRGGRGI